MLYGKPTSWYMPPEVSSALAALAILLARLLARRLNALSDRLGSLRRGDAVGVQIIRKLTWQDTN